MSHCSSSNGKEQMEVPYIHQTLRGQTPEVYPNSVISPIVELQARQRTHNKLDRLSMISYAFSTTQYLHFHLFPFGFTRYVWSREGMPYHHSLARRTYADILK